MLTDSNRYQLFKALKHNTNLSPRHLPSKLGYSLVQLNYSPEALINNDRVKAESFRSNQSKTPYLYYLTLAGITKTKRVAQQFPQRKVEDRQQIEQQIEILKQEVTRHPNDKDLSPRKNEGTQF